MFKYTPKKQIVRQLDKNKKNATLLVNWEYAEKILGKKLDRNEDFHMKFALVQNYSNVEFYSDILVRQVPVCGVLLTSEIFDVEEVLTRSTNS